MSHRYCICCQLRLGSNSDLYFEVLTLEMSEKINIAKSLILKDFKRTSNNQIAVIGVYIHKKCSLKVNRVLKKQNDYGISQTLNEGNYLKSYYNGLILLLLSDLIDNSTVVTENDSFNDYLPENIEANIHSNDYSTDYSNAVQEDVNNTKSSSIELTLSKGYSSHKYCFVCRAKDKNMVIIKSNPRYEIFSKTSIFIIKGSRLCSSHLDEKGFVKGKEMYRIKSINAKINFDTIAIEELLKNFQSAKNESQIYSQFSSSSPIQDNALKIIGFTKDEFLYLVYYVDDKMNQSNKRTKEQALFVYLFWLRTGLTLEVFYLIYQKIIFLSFSIL
jgi:hypothetical protein